MNSATDIANIIQAGLSRRHMRERRFRAFGLASIGFAALMLVILLATIVGPGISGFMRHELKLEVDTSVLVAGKLPEKFAIEPGSTTIDFYKLTNYAVAANQNMAGADATTRHQLFALLGTFAPFEMKDALLGDMKQLGKTYTVWVPLSSNADIFLKDDNQRHSDSIRSLSDQQIAWLDQWQKQGRIRTSLDTDFFSRGDSRAPESAGFLGSVIGSLFTLFVCMGLAMPIAIMAAITLEEFAKKTRIAEALEVLINNLAAVPSIIYGLLGLSVFLQVLNAPRSSALVGGLTLAIMILPVMIIAARAAIRAVPPSMRMAATGLGATRLQVVRHHVLPYALPGIMTGTILSICRALGETAPLLMIGMVAFVADIPRGLTDPATAMPVEIYLWASTPEAGFIEKTSSGILVLLVILLLLNLTAIRLRNRSQLTWN